MKISSKREFIMSIREKAILLLLFFGFSFPTSFADDTYKNWGKPYCMIYGGYSAKSDADWDMWQGVFNLVHHSLIGKDEKEVKHIFSLAREHRIKILTTVWLYDFKQNRIDEKAVAKLKNFYKRFGKEQALFGYGYEAAYKIPKDKQLVIYKTIKSIDPNRPVWMEFSSTSASTWQRGFNPDACDGLYPYLYPYESKDRDTNLIANTKRILYPIPAINKLKHKDTIVVPVIQAFIGGSWNKLPPKGSIMMQFRYWLNVDNIAGIGFYRWRTRGIYQAIPEIPNGKYVWKEVQTLCKELHNGKIKIDKSFAIKPKSSKSRKINIPKNLQNRKPINNTNSYENSKQAAIEFEAEQILIDQDFEDIAANDLPPPSDWDIKNSGLVISPINAGYPVGYKILKLSAKYPVIARTLPKWEHATKLSFWVKPNANGYAKGLVYLDTFSHKGYIASALRLGHGSGTNSNVFSYINKNGKWASLGIRWKAGNWYRVEILSSDEKITYNIYDIKNNRLNSKPIIINRRFAEPYRAIYFTCDGAKKQGVCFDKIELEYGYVK